MKVLDFLNVLRNDLPFKQLDVFDFRENVKLSQKLFLEKFQQVDESDLKKFLPVCDSHLTKKMLLYRFEKITKKLCDSIDAYLDGYPFQAFKELYKLSHNVSFISRLSDRYDNFLDLKDQRFIGQLDYFRMRVIDTTKGTTFPTSENLFHTPFENRGKVSTSRFSIPGYPCLYVSRSLKGCWLEINCPNENIFASRFQVDTNYRILQPLNITIPKPFTESIYEIDGDHNQNYEAFCFLLTFPIIQLCLFKVKEHDDIFKPEYIIPQLLMQYIKSPDVYFDSIMYSSTKEGTGEDLFHNLVIPIKETAKNGYCSALVKQFKLSNPLKVEFFTDTDLNKTEEVMINIPVENLSVRKF